MNKQEAAAQLDVSVRTLESYVAQNRLSVRYVKGKTRPVADFDAADVERLKAEIDAGVVRAEPRTAQTSSNLEELDNLAKNLATSQLPVSALARIAPPIQAASVVVLETSQLQELLLLAGTSNLVTSQNPQNLAAKLLLTLAEAQILTGLSRETLKTAIENKQLPAQRMGRAWRLRPEDVREWLRTSFETK